MKSLGAPYARLLEAWARRYRTGRSPSTRLSRPVVSVGNLTLGGTGKTPFVEFLANGLIREGRRPAILSRGYGRSTRGVVVVSKGDGPLVGPDEGGDEPVALARRLRGVPIVVARRRADAAAAALPLDGDVFVLDDGYQHLALQRDVNLLLLDARDPFSGGRFPPFGRLREPLSALARADAFVFTRIEKGFPTPAALATVAKWNPRAPVFNARIRPEGLRDEAGSRLENAGRFVGVCGIARPKSFEAALSELGLAAEETTVFSDHHRYGRRDLARILGAVRRTGSSRIVTTEKDSVKLSGRLPLPIATLRLAVEVLEPDFFRFLMSRLPRSPEAASALPR